MCAMVPPVDSTNKFHEELLALQFSGAQLEARRAITEGESEQFSQSVSLVLEKYIINESQYRSNADIANVITTLYDAVERIREKALGKLLAPPPPPRRFEPITPPPSPRLSNAIELEMEPLETEYIPLVEVISDTFYQFMINYSNMDVMKNQDLKDHHVQLLLSAFSLIESMERSRGVNGVVLQNNLIISLEAFPRNYRDLGEAILTLKDAVNGLNPKDRFNLYNFLIGETIDNEKVVTLGNLLKEMAEAINQNPAFQSILTRVVQSRK